VGAATLFEYPVITKDQIKPGVFRIDHDEYHEGEGVSSSELKTMLRSPAHAKVKGTYSPALAFGRAFHMAILEPELFESTYTLMPKFSGTGMKARKEAWLAENEGKETLSEDDYGTIRHMSAAVKASKFWPRIKDYDVEIAHFAQDPKTNILMKCKADMIGDWIIDVKSTQNASGESFVRDAIKFGYHISAAYYQDIVKLATGRMLPFMWIAVEKSEPYGVAFYEADSAMLEVGREEYLRALSIYGKCIGTGEWPAYPDTIQELPIPGWFWKG